MQAYKEAISKLLVDPEYNVEISPILGDAVRMNLKRPARIEFFVPDDWVKNINGNEKLVDGYLAMRIPIESLQKFGIAQEGNVIMDSEAKETVSPEIIIESPVS